MAKICPLRETSKSGAYGEPCREEKCALWFPGYKMCTLKYVAVRLHNIDGALESVATALEAGRRG